MEAKSFRNTFHSLLAIALTAATLALTAALPARATTFIKDVMLIGGTQSTTTTLKTQYESQGWSVILYDLNHGCTGSTDYIFLLYKAEEDTGGDRDYVTGFYIKQGASGVTTNLTNGGKTYTLVPYDGDDHFMGQKGDLNSHAGGDAIHLYYTKDNSAGTAISSVTFDGAQSGALSANGGSTGYDLNAGAGGDYVYMHVSSKTVAYGIAYNLGGGTNASGNPSTYTVNSAAITLADPARTGYTFTGWTWSGQSTPTKPVTIAQGSTGNKSYTANWTPVNYSISYTLNGGTLPGGHPTSYTIESATITLADPARTGYTFAGWTWSGQTTPQASVTIAHGSTGNKSYTANWNANPVGRIDSCAGGAGTIAVSGWAYDPDAPAQSIDVQVKVYEQDGSTPVREETLAADRPRDDVNSAYGITGRHGYSASYFYFPPGTYKVKVFALDANGGTNPQLGSTQTVAVRALPPVAYIDESGATQQCAVYTALADAPAGAACGVPGAENWYVVTNDVVVNGPLRFNDGTARLILCDGATLTVTNANGAAVEAGALVVYGQADGTGTLAATGDDAGITVYGITVYGGTVAATGGDYGIISDVDIWIRGGTVTARGGIAGISSSYDILIEGGAVTATGGDYGIASPRFSIHHATVTATGDDCGIYAFISGRKSGRGTISDAIVTATGGNYGICVEDSVSLTWEWGNPTYSITSSGYAGTVYLENTPWITDGSAVYEGAFGYEGDHRRELTPAERDAIAGKTLRCAVRLTLPEDVVAGGIFTRDGTTAYALPGATITLTAATPGHGIGEVFYVPGRPGASPTIVTPSDLFSASFTLSEDECRSAGCDFIVNAKACAPVPYIDENGVERLCGGYTVLTNATGRVRYGYESFRYDEIDSWYVVTNDVTVNGSISLYNNAHLILCDGATLSVTNNPIDECFYAHPGLSIYGQTNGTGRITARSIGTNSGGAITINGGIVTSVIGTCYLTINGGTVTAIRSPGQVGIQATYININGGNVTAIADDYGIGTFDFGGIIDEQPIMTITLGWTKPTDSIYASSYCIVYGTPSSPYFIVKVAPGQALTDGSAIYEGTLDAAQIVAIGGKTLRPYIAEPAFPWYLDGADDRVKTNYVSWAMRNGYDDAGGHEAAFLLNVAPSATPVELRIVGVELVEGGARVRVAAAAGGDSVDLSQVNGILSLAAGDDLGSLAPKAVPASNVTYASGTATIFVSSSAGNFIKALLGAATPTE